MDSSLHEVWQAAASSPFYPSVNKGSQFWVGFLLVLLGIGFTGVFALSMCPPMTSFGVPLVANQLFNRSIARQRPRNWYSCVPCDCVCSSTRYIYPNISTDFLSFGVVYMFCAVGVYV